MTHLTVCQRIASMVHRVVEDEREIGVLSTGESIAVAVVLDRRDLLPSLYPEWAEAIVRLGEEWHLACLEVSRTIGPMAAKKKPGKNIPNAQRHTVQVLLRVPPEVAEELDELAEKWGVTRSGVVGLLLDQRAARRSSQHKGDTRRSEGESK